MTTRAKFRCNDCTPLAWGADQYKFTAITADNSEIPEDRAFWNATPVGTLDMTINNPAVKFVPGKCYYLDITEVPEVKQ